MSDRLLDVLIPRVAHGYTLLLRATTRIEYRNREVLDRLRAAGKRHILAFWHSRLVLMPQSVQDKQRFVGLLSRHRDARRLGAMLGAMGFQIAWGSTTRGGVPGTREILRRLRQGFDAGIAPDGPKGPRRRVQPGVVAIARLSGHPIVPVSWSARPARRLRSWDRTLLPYPFGRALFLYGEPIEVPRDADEPERERLRRLLERELDRLTDEADLATGLGREDDRPPPPGHVG